MGRKITAFLAKFCDRHFILIFAFFAILLFNFPFDGQAMTIPARHIIGIFPQHGLRAVNHIFQNFIQRMTDMQLAIGIGRAIMQHKFRGISPFCPQSFIQIQLLPMRQNLGLFFWQAAPHGKICLWKKYGLFIIHHLISDYRWH